MNYKLSRRRFGQLVIAGTVISGITYLGNRASAQTQLSNLKIVSISPSSIISAEPTVRPEVNTTELDSTLFDGKQTASITVGLVVQTLSVTKSLLQSLLSLLGLTDQTTFSFKSNETLTGLTSLYNGTLVLAITPASGSRNHATPTRITFLGSRVKTLLVSGLKKNEQLSSLLVTKDGKLIGLAGKRNGTPPITLVSINPETGVISSNKMFQLPPNERFNTLAECPDGNLYTVVVGTDGETTLVKLDLQQNQLIKLATLQVNGQQWDNGLESLICSADGQLFAFGALRYEGSNALYRVDKNNGNMTLVQKMEAAKITLAHE